MAHCAMEIAIDPFLTFDDKVGFDLSFPTNDRLEAARRCLIANAVMAEWKGLPGVHYSRDNSYYAAQNTGLAWYSRRSVIAALDELAAAGLLTHKPTRPSPNALYRSRFSATPKLMKGVPFTSVTGLAEVSRRPIEIRDRTTDCLLDPCGLPASQLPILRALGEDVTAQNALLASSNIELRPGSYPRIPEGIAAVGRHVINPTQRTLRRVFRNDLNLGGRWYGPRKTSPRRRGRAC